jgi:hypothetical protein
VLEYFLLIIRLPVTLYSEPVSKSLTEVFVMSNYYDFPYNEYGFDQGSAYAASWAPALIAVIIGVVVVALAIAIVLYVFESIALYSIAKKRGIENPWLAWIPVGNAFLIGKIADYYDLRETGKSNNFAIWMLCLSGATLVLSFTVILSFIGVMAAIALAVFEYICFYKFYKHVNPQNSTLLLVLSILFSVALPFILFAHRNKDDLYMQTPQYQPYPPQGYQPPQGGYQQPGYQAPPQGYQPPQNYQPYQPNPNYQPNPQQYQPD